MCIKRLTLIVFPALLVLSSIAHAHSKRATLNLIIDTDLALGMKGDGNTASPSDIDDVFAIIEALRAPELHLLGMTTVFGNANLESVNRAMKNLSNYTHDPLPMIVSGASQASSFHEPCPNGAQHAADFIASILRKHQKVNIAAIGPLSNIACLTKRHPNVLHRIDRVLVVMGQSPETKFEINSVPITDFNFQADSAAAQYLLDSPLKISLFPFELTRSSLISRSDIDSKAQKGSLAQYIRDDGIAFMTMWKSVFKENGIHPWDSAPIAHLRDPSLFKCEASSLIIERQAGTKLVASGAYKTPSSHYFCHEFSNQKAREKFEHRALQFL